MRCVDCCGDMISNARHGDFRINMYYSGGGGGGGVVLGQVRLLPTDTSLCRLLVRMVVDERGVSKRSDYTVASDPFSVYSQTSFSTRVKEYERDCVCERRAPFPQIVVSVCCFQFPFVEGISI